MTEGSSASSTSGQTTGGETGGNQSGESGDDGEPLDIASGDGPDHGSDPADSARKSNPARTSTPEVSPRGIFDPGLWWLALIVVPIGVWGITRRTDIVVLDSDKFVKALEEWRPIFTANASPRAIKRYINRVRFHSLQLQAGEQEYRLLEHFETRLRHWWTVWPQISGRLIERIVITFKSPVPMRTTPEDEDQLQVYELVALSAISEYNADWCNKPELWENPSAFLHAMAEHQEENLGENVVSDTLYRVSDQLPRESILHLRGQFRSLQRAVTFSE